jgi:hypothetical protein
MFVAELLFGLFRGPGLKLFRMDLQAKALFRASFWVASRGCSLELKNSERQYWGSIAEDYRTPTGKENGTRTRKKDSGTESKANSCSKILPPCGARAGLFIGEVKGLITMP